MSALFVDVEPTHRPGEYECHVDPHGVRHAIRSGEAAMHWTTIRCECSPKVKSVVDDDGGRYFVLIHRRMRNSRNLFKPWEAGH